jgi:hypothetical protein
MKSLRSRNANLEDDNQTKFEEIKLLKDYVYGMDHRAKEVHKHKFMIKQNIENFDTANGGKHSSNLSNC